MQDTAARWICTKAPTHRRTGTIVADRRCTTSEKSEWKNSTVKKDSRPTFEIARVTSVVKASASRVTPRCPHFGVCGGCTLQHAHPSLQVAAKQRALEEALARIGRVQPERMLPPIEGPAWVYRYRARLTVRNVAKKGGVLVGFHERKSSFVAEIRSCDVLPRNGIETNPGTSSDRRLAFSQRNRKQM